MYADFFNEGLALFERGTQPGSEKALSLAIKKFKDAATLQPQSFELWHAWGMTLAHMGKVRKENRFLVRAKEKYQKALPLLEGQPVEIQAEFYWDYAFVWSELASYSQEALDWQLALDAYRKAADLKNNLPTEFWHDYGHTCLQLAGKINDIHHYVKAINCFKHALSLENASDLGWGSLADALTALYSHTHDEDHFSQANECFAAVAQLRPEDVEQWLAWAQFLCESGKRNGDIKRLRSCIEKCHRAYVCDPEDPLASAIWGEALAFIGEISDRHDLIQEGLSKIVEADADDIDVLYCYGMCLLSFARYFNDFDYYYQAIERFQFGLSIDRTSHRLWNGLATVYAIIGQVDPDKESLEKACRFYTKAIDLIPSSYYIFDYALALSKLGEMTRDAKILEDALLQFERVLSVQKNAIYIHPDWLFHYACTLDHFADFHDEDSYYTRAIEILSHVLMIDPDFPGVHHRLGLTFSHLGELTSDVDCFYRAVHHFRLAAKHDEENDQIIADWGVSLMNLADHTPDLNEADQLRREAEHKIIQAAKLGNLQAYYHLSGLYSLLGQYEKSLRFLEKAHSYNSLPSIDEIMDDDWLDGLRCTSGFQEMLPLLEKKTNM